MDYKTVLVTGGGGFIGSHLVEGLLENGHEVRILDDFSTGKRENIRSLGAAPVRPGKDFEVIEGDIRDLDTVRAAVSGVDAVLHQAALGSVPRSVEDPVTTQHVNADGTLHVFLAARDAGARRVVYASSSAVYGDTETLPKKEGIEGRPLSPYALTKRINEEYGRLFSELYSLEAIGLRYFNVFGARQDPDSAYAAVIPRFVKALVSGKPPVIYGTGKQTRDFTYVKDVVSANFRALEAPSDACGKAFNVGRGGQYSVLEILGILQDLLEAPIKPIFDPPRPGDVMHSMADVSSATELLGWTSEYDLRSGLEQSLEWYRTYLG